MFSNPFKILLLIMVIISKEILVLNEEILIVLAFTIFIYLILNNASSMISEELDQKALSIQNKFEIYKNIQEKTIIHLSNYYKKRELLSDTLQIIYNIKKIRIALINRYYKITLKKQPFLQIDDTLNRFILNEYIYNTAFQKSCISKLTSLKKRIQQKTI